MYLRHYQQARDALSRYLDRASRKAEARFFYLTSIRELGRRDEYVERTRALVADFPQSSWAEEALNNLGTHYILTDDDDAADATFREMYAKFPQGAHTERAGVEGRLVGPTGIVDSIRRSSISKGRRRHFRGRRSAAGVSVLVGGGRASRLATRPARSRSTRS